MFTKLVFFHYCNGRLIDFFTFLIFTVPEYPWGGGAVLLIMAYMGRLYLKGVPF